MDFGGQNLKTLKRNGFKFDKEILKLLLCQVIHALKQIHSLSITHCDIKPANLVVRPVHTPYKYNFILTDFGLSKYIVDKNGKYLPKERSDGIAGTINFLDPRVYDGWNFDNNKSYYNEIQRLKKDNNYNVSCLCQDIKIAHFNQLFRRCFKTDFYEKPLYEKYASWFDSKDTNWSINEKNQKILDGYEIDYSINDDIRMKMALQLKTIDQLENKCYLLEKSNKELKEQNNFLELTLKHKKRDIQNWQNIAKNKRNYQNDYTQFGCKYRQEKK